MALHRSSFVVRQRCQPLRWDILHIRLASFECVFLAVVHVNTDNGEPLLGESDRQRQAHVAQADDGDGGAVIVDFGEKLMFHSSYHADEAFSQRPPVTTTRWSRQKVLLSGQLLSMG